MSKIENILGGSDTETMISNSNLVAVSGDTDNIDALGTTSEENMFTQTENLVPIVKLSRDENSFSGGENIELNKLHMLLQETENNMNGGNQFTNLRQLFEQTETEFPNSLTGQHNTYMNKLSTLLEQNETEYNNVITGGSNQDMNKLRQLFEQTETENNNLTNIINFKGGALANVSLFNGGADEELKPDVQEEHEKQVHEVHEEHVQEEDNDDTDQSGGSSQKLDSELIEILKSLKQNKIHENPQGGKSRKTSKKSKASKKSKKSRRATTENTETTYMNNDNTDSDDQSEDYLTSTSSINTSDINIKHYKN